MYWWRRQRSVQRKSDQPGLDMRGLELIGQTFVVQESIINGRGKIKVGDGVWMVVGPDAPAGDGVRVTAQDGTILHVVVV